MSELNQAQAQAVAHATGPLLIFAGAGSGKTRTITYRIANLLARHRVPPYRILAVTFTNKAAGEMKHRLEQLTGPELSRDLWVGTFHAVCARVLRRYHEELGYGQKFVIYDDADQKAVMNRLLKALKIDDRQFPAKVLLQRIHAEKREGRRPAEMDLCTPADGMIQTVYEGYQNALRTANAWDFEDLILEAMRLAEATDSAAGRELRERFDHVLVDEFQDTNWTQYRLVRALSAATRNLCVVGDDDQSIYRWRGADVRIIRGFRQDFADAQVIKLEQNYRSTQNIVAAALGVIQPALAREPKQLWTAEEPGQPVVVHGVADERQEAAWVTSRVREVTGAGVDPGQIAIFYRIHAQSRVLEEALRADGVPYQIIGGMKFFERAEVKDLIAYLRLLENPRSDADLLRIINVPARGIGAKSVQRLLDVAADRGTCCYEALPSLIESSSIGAAAKKKLSGFYEQFEQWREQAAQLLPSELAERVVDQSGYLGQLRQADNAEADARLENLKELIGSISEFERDAAEAGEAPSLSSYLERVSLVSAVDNMSDQPSVSLMTVHAAKGLEFDTVIMTGMEDEIFPYRGVDGRDSEELEEERRLAYVAITRARRRLLIAHATMRTIFGQTRYLAPSRFLADLPAEVVQLSEAPAPAGLAYRWGGGARPQGQAAGRRGHSGEAFSATSGRGRDARRAPSGALRHGGGRRVEYDAIDPLPSDEPGVVLRPGDTVRHRRFGAGVVQSVDCGVAPSVTAKFPGFGVRKVLAEYLQFEPSGY